ncbi:hypothetical protein [Paraclostridium bifermentans]|uniref:hypothetical protein n=1 Tax=Paraclostridium bifermentans TaxID=1490 RepID=UPI00359C2806
MKYILIFIVILLFISPNVDKCNSIGEALKSGIYNYITCVDNTVNYLVENTSFFNKLSEIPYTNAYKNIMSDRHFVKHFIEYGETLDDIIKFYNKDINNLDDFRKVVYKENSDIVSKDYDLKAGNYILVPSE